LGRAGHLHVELGLARGALHGDSRVVRAHGSDDGSKGAGVRGHIVVPTALHELVQLQAAGSRHVCACSAASCRTQRVDELLN
tara:strand:+ start:327 stop:572 length:246 start_codon:yes stop_codon:yes gene_type:complete